jgi:hypothetical protein
LGRLRLLHMGALDVLVPLIKPTNSPAFLVQVLTILIHLTRYWSTTNNIN